MKIICAKKNIASKNIAEKIREISPKTEILEFDTDVLEVSEIFEEMIVLSSHKSKNPVPMLTVHVPGNWNDADFGGLAKTLNICNSNLIRRILCEIEKNNVSMGLNWKISLECDHHGPTFNVPITFVEIGSSEKEWENELAGLAVARSILEGIKRKDLCETVFAIGGGHYAEKFTNLCLKGKYSIGHILPKYKIESVNDDIMKEAIRKNDFPCKKILVDENCNLLQKKRIEEFCKKNDLSIEYV